MGFFGGSILCGGIKPNTNWCGQKGAICALAWVSLVGLLATMAFGYVTLIHNPEGIVKQICQDVHHLMGDLGNSGIPAFILFPAGIALVGASVSMKCAGSNIMSKGYCIRVFLLAVGLTVTVLTPVIFNSVDGDIMTHVWMYVIPATAGVLGLPAFWPRKVTVINTYRNGWEQVYINNNKEVLYYRDPEGKLHTKLPAELPLPEASVDTQDLSQAGANERTYGGLLDDESSTKSSWVEDAAAAPPAAEEADHLFGLRTPAKAPWWARKKGHESIAVRRRLASPQMRRLVEEINAAA